MASEEMKGNSVGDVRDVKADELVAQAEKELNKSFIRSLLSEVNTNALGAWRSHCSPLPLQSTREEKAIDLFLSAACQYKISLRCESRKLSHVFLYLSSGAEAAHAYVRAAEVNQKVKPFESFAVSYCDLLRQQLNIEAEAIEHFGAAAKCYCNSSPHGTPPLFAMRIDC